jgi:hypothetical protein
MRTSHGARTGVRAPTKIDGMDCNCGGHGGIGHDQLGHTVTNALRRAGLYPAWDKDLARLPDSQFLSLPGLGAVSLQRFRTAVGAPHGVLPTPDVSSTATRRRSRRSSPRVKTKPATMPPGLLFLGDDRLGRRLALLLARHGWLAPGAGAIAEMSDAELLKVRNLGLVGLARIREHIPYRGGTCSDVAGMTSQG